MNRRSFIATITALQIAYELQKDTSDNWRTPWETEDYVFVVTEAAILAAVLILCFIYI